MALILVMGIPGSGKTTLSTKLEVMTNFCHHQMKREGKFSVPPYESILWSISNSFIIVDDIFYLRSMRRPFERMARAHSLCYIIIFVDETLEIALQRNKGRPPKVFIPEKTIHRIYEEMDIPTENTENFIRFSSSDELNDLITKIQCIFSTFKKRNCHKLVETSPQDTASKDDTLQNLEKEMRKCISELVRGSKSKDLARNLGKVKKEIMSEFRRNNLKTWSYSDLKNRLLLELSRFKTDE
uniref:L-seryl-tRNA(Sec) kinase n=1 Tax=Syphacia muris TaxID=451379 RepID=A0A0N5AJQ5_9BILA